MSIDDNWAVIYSKKWSKLLMAPLFIKLFTKDPAVRRVNRELESSYISVPKLTRKSLRATKSLLNSILIMIILFIYILRYLCIVNLSPQSKLLPLMSDFLFPLGPSGHWIYFFFNIGMGTSIANRFTIAFSSFRGNMGLYKDWKDQSTSVYRGVDTSLDPKVLQLEKTNIFIYNLTKMTVILANFIVGAVGSVMFVLSISQMVQMSCPKLHLLIFILWVITWYPALYFSVNGVIYPISLAMCGVYYSKYLADICVDCIECFRSFFEQNTVNLKAPSNSMSMSKLSTSVVQLRHSIGKQDRVLRRLLLIFISFATFSASSVTFLAVYVQSNYKIMQYLLLGMAVVLWMLVVIIPTPLTQIPGQIDTIYRKLQSLQSRCQNLSREEKWQLFRLIESVGDLRCPIAYHIIDGLPFSSAYHFSFILNIITVIFLMINFWRSQVA